jgi:HlyD family secretion protein
MKERSILGSLSDTARRHPYWTGGVALAAIAFIAYLASSGSPENAETAYFKVKRGAFTVSVVEGGTLQAVNEVSIRNVVEGSSRIIYIVPEGSQVKEGDLLVELDSMQAQDQFNQQQINFEKARFGLIQAANQLEIKKSEVQSLNRKASNEVLFAQMAFDKYVKADSLVNLLSKSNAITAAEETLTRNREILRWSEELYEKGYETKDARDGDRLAVTRGVLDLEVLKLELMAIDDYDDPKTKIELEATLDEAQSEYDRVRQEGLNTIAQYEADLLSQSNTLELNKAKLERDRKNLDATKVLAPQDGLVVYSFSENRWSSESMIEEGATVRNRQELIKLPDTSKMKVSIKVHESHVNMVEPGKPAFVVLDSLPDERFAAYVDKVALLPDNQSRFGNPNLKVYNTDIIITDPMPDVKPGVSASAEVIITNIANSLSVPIQAVTTLTGKQVCYVKRGGTEEPREVEIGMFNTRFIQILSGLEEGDQVLLSPPFEQRNLEGAILEEDEVIAITNTAPRPMAGTLPREGRSPGDAPTERAQGGRQRGGPEGLAGAQGGPQGMGGQRPGARGQGQGGMDREQMRAQFEQMRKQFDKDGDGELNEEERAAMRADIQKRFGGTMGGGRGQGEGGPGRGGQRGGGQSGEGGGGNRPSRPPQ